MEWRIRDYADSDYAAVSQLMRELQGYEQQFDAAHLEPDAAFAKAYLTNLFASLSDSEGRLLVAERNGTVGGFVAGLVVEDHERGEQRFHVAELSVSPELRGQGVGADLMRVMEQHASAKGFKRMSVSVMARSERTHALYRKLGFADYTVTLEKAL